MKGENAKQYIIIDKYDNIYPLTLNDAKIDMIVDKDCDWFIDYNESLYDEETDKPIGTIIIPSFLYHGGEAVDSRSILKSAEETFKEEVFKLMSVINSKKPYVIEFTGTPRTGKTSLINNLLDFSLIFSAPLCFGICGIAVNFVTWYLPESFS